MGQTELKCTTNITTSLRKICWSGTAFSLQTTLVALFIKKYKCEDGCDFYVIAHVIDYGKKCPNNANKQLYGVVMQAGCLKLNVPGHDHSYEKLETEEAIEAMLTNFEENDTTKPC